MEDFILFILMIVAIIFAMIAQGIVKSTFNKYSKVPNKRGITGAQAAEHLLKHAGVHDVAIQQTPGSLTDHYDPKAKTIRLSEAVYGSASLAALGVAAHEAGHAIQHANSYMPLAMRSAIFPVANFGSRLAWPMIIGGIILTAFAGQMSGDIGMFLIFAGIIVFSAYVLFQIVTLPVEFNASHRAIDMLETTGIIDGYEAAPARKVLNAAALTYIAAAAVAVIQLLRLILIFMRRR